MREAASVAPAVAREALTDGGASTNQIAPRAGVGALHTISEQTYGPVIAAISELLDAGKRDGSIRRDADPGDFLRLTAALWRAATGPHGRSPRLLGPVLDGLRSQPQRS